MRRLLPIFLLLLLMGCQSLEERKQSMKLEDTLRKYEATIRWGALDQARQFQSAAAMELPAAEPKQMRVIHYETIRGPSMVAPDKAVQVVVIQYVFSSSQVVKELMDQQVWTFDQESGAWLLQSPFPEFK